MGENTTITFALGAKVRDVALAISVLTGYNAIKSPLGKNGIAGWWAKAHPRTELQVRGFTGCPEMCQIIWIQNNGETRCWHYHYEWCFGGVLGATGMMPKSYAKNIAVLVKLADLFGGWVDFNDSDEIDADYCAEGSSLRLASDDDDWRLWQEKLLALEPLTPEEIMVFDKFAAYKVVEGELKS